MARRIAAAISGGLAPGMSRAALVTDPEGQDLGERKRIYDLISELASHASYSGISLKQKVRPHPGALAELLKSKGITLPQYRLERPRLDHPRSD